VSRKIYDSFPFDGELDLLEHRLRQNFAQTDVFVLIEASETYRGVAKPCLFHEHAQRFAWAASKIRALKLSALGPQPATPRDRAAVQRNALMLALYDAANDDIVLLLDADEIPSRALLQDLKTHGLAEPHRIEMTRHYQRLNLLAPASTCCVDPAQPFSCAAAWDAPQGWDPARKWLSLSGVALRMRDLRGEGASSPYQWRFANPISKQLPRGGRHLTAVDPSAELSYKMRRVFHAEWATERGTYGPHIARCTDHAVHHRGWWYAESVPGKMPPDLLALGETYPHMLRHQPLPPLGRRRLVRSWAWLRQSPWLADRWVLWVDDRFERLLPLLALPLLALDGARHVLAAAMRRLGTGRDPTQRSLTH
jgi:beta-1,4-mannosyl-glycoprotein beta-1,4-N-acetylglucosaminyltransferase